MRITVLMENTSCRADLTAEHGLSLYIEACGKRILFDAGQTDAFADNAKKLGVDLSRVDFAVLSHGHYDHSGGLMRFLQENDHAPVYMHRDAPQPHWHGPDRYIGIDPAVLDSGRIILADDDHDLGDGLSLCSCNGLPMAFAPSFGGLHVMRDNALAPDDFRHEQYLIIEEDGQRKVISGCSHKGAMNVLTWLSPDVLIGGFHFVKHDPEGEALRYAAKSMAELDCRYYTGHCTGEKQLAVLQAALGNRLRALSAGLTFTV